MNTFGHAAGGVDLAAYGRGQMPADLTIGDHGALSARPDPRGRRL